ncbi:MAG: hypothetical protein HQL95_08270 [Magnetococcales bacterium]|nr:hypothetical protein [Magnetococcales bacterium]
MSSKGTQDGFSLLEAIFFIVVSGIALSAIIPLYGTVLSNVHVLSDNMQAEYLGLEMIERINAVYNKASPPATLKSFILVTEAQFPSEVAIDLGGGAMKFDRTVEVQGRINNVCTGIPYNGEAEKCVFVRVKDNRTGQELYKDWSLYVNF